MNNSEQKGEGVELKNSEQENSKIADKCKVSRCKGRKHAKGYCSKHYARIRQTGKLTRTTANSTRKEIYESHILSMNENGCIEWKGARSRKDKYGTAYIRGKSIPAHRLSYELHKGKIPKDMVVCHQCDNPSCVNPEHLFLGTLVDNRQDCLDKNRHAKGERCGASKLKTYEVIEIKQLLKSGKFMQKEIAKMFNIAPSVISAIHRGVAWAHI